ncbi:Intracellular protease 1 [uncultured archaeon]|nr:Intracellular protease 1 [uncultured archaeon]
MVYLFQCSANQSAMKTSSITLILLLLLAGAFPAFAQYSFGAAEGVTCWQCPVCGYTVSLTPYELASVNPYTPCPVCYSTYAFYFVQVPCQTATGYDAGYNTEYNTSNNSAMPSNRSVPVAPVPSTGSDSSSASAKGKILMVLPPQQYQETELNEPRNYFQSQGYSVVLASKGVKTATGMSGESVSVDLDLKAVTLSEYSAVVFVGGEGIYYQKINEDPDFQALAKAAAAQNKLIGAICLGPWVLADAGLLQGKRATASETDHIKAKGAIVSNESVVRDGNIITGNGPSASLEFAQAIVAALEESGSSAEQGVSGKEAGLAPTVPLGPSSQAASTQNASKWKCTVCGYIYDPAEHGGVAFEQLPSTWKCPTCGASKSKFVKIYRG